MKEERAICILLIAGALSMSGCAACHPVARARVDSSCLRGFNEPLITVSSADKAGSFYSDDFTIKGTIRGRCLASAGIYAADTEIVPIELDVADSGETSQNFEITVDASLEPEIRAVTTSGVAQVLKIDVLDIRG